MNDKIENAVAYIIGEISESRGSNPGKKTLQKMVFLIQHKGVNLGFDYGLHFYGPYCSALDAMTTFLDAEGVIDFDYTSYSHRMKINDTVEVASGLDITEEKMVDDVILEFIDSSPSQLELLTTAMYAFEHLPDKSIPSIVKGVKKIKGTKYSDREIESAIERLKYFGIACCN